MIISMRAVRRPRRVYYCDACRAVLYEHAVFFGAAEVGDKPYQLRLCPDDITDEQRKALGLELPARPGSAT